MAKFENLEVNHPDPIARLLALRELQINGSYEDIESIRQRLLKERNVELRFEIKRSLNEFDTLTAKIKLAKQNNKSPLKEALISSDPNLQAQAAHYCAIYHHIEMISLILDVFESNKDPIIGISAIHLMRFTPERYYQELANYLKSDNLYFAITALDSLGYIGNIDSIILLLEATLNSNPIIKECANLGLERLGNYRISLAILDSLKGLSDTAKTAVCTFAKKLCDSEFINILLRLLPDDNEHIRANALQALQAMSMNGCETATQVLNSLEFDKDNFQDQQPYLTLKNQYKKSLAVRVLNARYFDEAKDMILAETDTHLQAAALLTISHFDVKWEELRAFLLCWMTSDDPRIRANVLEAMAYNCPESDIAFFLNFIDDENNRISGNAIIGLASSNQFKTHYLHVVNQRLSKMLNSSEEKDALTALYCIGSLQEDSLLNLLAKSLSHQNQTIQIRSFEILQNWALVSQSAQKILQDHLNKAKVSQNKLLNSNIFAIKVLMKQRGIQAPDHDRFSIY